jgi:spore germination protein KC
MKLKIIIAFFLILTTIPLWSCGSFAEMEERYIVLGAAVDYDFDKKLYNVTVEIVNVQDSTAETIVSKYYSGSGRSMFDAVRNIVKVSGKKLFWAHTKVLIIAKDIAAESVYPVFDWVNRDQEVRDDMLIVVSKEKTAEEVIRCKASVT